MRNLGRAFDVSARTLFIIFLPIIKYRAYTAQNARYFFSTAIGLFRAYCFLPVASSGRPAQGDREGRPYISCRWRGLEICIEL